MNNFDKQRIENAIWILNQYEEEIRQIAKEKDFDTWDCDKVFNILDEIKEKLQRDISE